MRIATWNVNSINSRLAQVLEWVEGHRPDVLCLQEIKCVEEKFPAAAFQELGYQAEVFGQPTYNGVATLSLQPMRDAQRGLPDDAPDAQRRLLATTINGVRVINIYVPNGQSVGSDQYQFKLAWLARLRAFLDEHHDPQQPLVLCGDFNVAPEDRDVHNPRLWAGRVLCSEPERAALGNVYTWGFVDLFRQHIDEPSHFSWWDYRAGAFPRNQGLRIDHLWATAPLADRCTDVWIDKIPRARAKPSDHAPVIAEFAI